MAASRHDIEDWFKEGVVRGATHMIVVTDTFSGDSYPIHVEAGESARERAEEYAGKLMQKVDEVYDLGMDMTAQMAEMRALHY